MKISPRKKKGCVFLLYAHLVFVTKYRKKILTIQHIDILGNIFRKVCKSMDVVLVEFNGENDHIHLLVNYPPKISISILVNRLKGISSRMVKVLIPSLNLRGAFWSPSYFVCSCGGAPLKKIKQYIQNQQTPKN